MTDMRKYRRRSWFLRRVVLGLAAAAVAIPTVQARLDQATV